MLQKGLLFIFILISFLGFTQENTAQLKQQLNTITDDTQKSKVLLKICNQYLESQKSIDSVFRYTKQLEGIAIKTADDILLAKAHDITNEAHHLAANYDLSIKHGKKAIAFYEKNKLFKEAARVKKTIGDSHQETYKYKEAIRYYLEAEKILSEEEKIEVYTGLGNVHVHTGNLEKSVNYYNQAFEIATRLELAQHHYSIYNGLAGVYFKDKKYTKSLEYLNKALAITIKESDFFGQTVCHSNIGDVYKTVENYQSSKKSYETGIALFDKISHKFIKANIHLNYAETLLNLDLLDQAKNNLVKTEGLLSQANITALRPNIAVIKASIEHKKGNLEESVIILEDLIQQSKKSNNEFTDLTKQIYLNLSEVYQDLNNTKKAFNSYKKYSSIKDSISSRIKTKEFNALKIKFDISSYEQDLKVKNQELLVSEAKKEMSNYRNVLLGVLSIGLVFFLYRQRRLNNINKKTMLAENQVVKLKEEQLHTEMKYKNNQITEYAIHINERNKFQDTCIDKIKHIKKETELNVIRAYLINLQFYIKENISVNNEKIALNKAAKKTEESFIFTLKNKFPNLTTKEIKVATLLILELSTKSIASQMSISEQSIKNYRSSIRRKIGASRNDDLVTLLKTI